MAKFRNKYRIESARLQGWDYRTPGAYFITICTHNRIHHFGECKNGKMKLSTIGLLVQGCWFQIPHYNHHVRLGEFVVMPNHIHGVLILDEMDGVDGVETRQCHVSTNTQKKITDENFYRDITPLPGSVSVMLGSFKSACSKHIHKTFPSVEFEWQE